MQNSNSMSKAELAAALEKSERERQELQRRLKDEAFYHTLFESIIEPYYQADLAGRLINGNLTGARMLGYETIEEILGKDIAQEFYSDPSQREDFLHALREHGSVSGFRCVLRTKTGTLLTVEISAQIVTSKEGDPLYIQGMFRDVTAKVEAEEQVLVSEIFYRNLFENTGAATVLFGNDGVIQKCNAKFVDLAGLPREKILGKLRWADFVDAKDLERMRTYHEQRVKEGSTPPKEYNFLFVSHGGQRKHVHVTVEGIREFESRIASLVDITDLKRAEADLYAAKQEFESIFDNSQVGIMLLRGGRTLSRGNKRLADIFGYDSPDEMRHMSMRQIHLSERNFLEFGEKYYSALSKNEQIQIEYQLRRKDGTPVWCSISGKALDPENLDKGVLWVIDDITERKQADFALREARNYIRNIIDSMPAILVGVDVSGRITQWNAAACAATGITPEAAEGAPMEAVLPWLGIGTDALHESLRSGNPCTLNAVSVSQKGETRYKDITIYPLVDAKENGAVLVADDVTERLLMEDILIQNEKMMSVGGLAAGMAHEINNPLCAIMGAVQIVRKRLSAENATNKKVRENLDIDVSGVHDYLDRLGILHYLDGIHESGARAADIVRKMLDFSRPSSQAKEPCDLRTLLDDSVDLVSKDYNLQTHYDFKAIDIVREYAEDLPKLPVITSEIRQVFLNLLSNAAHALIERIRTSKDAAITLRLQRARGFVRIEIQDNGPGIDAKVRKRIFEPFYTTKTPGEGTGLGLSVSYFIITRNHGGSMSVKSTPGQGATFVVRLPLTM